MKKILYFNNIFPLYRESIWKLLLDENKYNFNIYFSEQNLKGIKAYNASTDKHFNKKLHPLRNYFLNGILIWQSKVIFKSIKENFDIAIFMGEMTIISTWIAAIVCKLRNKKVYFWTHGLYGNESRLKKNIRILFLKLSDKNLLYENRAKKLLIKEGLTQSNQIVVYNSLNYEKQSNLFDKLEYEQVKSSIFNKSLPIIVFIGRLTHKKKLEILIKAISLINKTKPKVNLLIIGEGSERKSLVNLSSQNLLADNYHFYGEVFDEEEIAKLLYTATICVSPGNVGLTAIHSLSYGTPVATHKDLKHQMPEAESIIDGENGFLFNKDDEYDLAKKIQSWIEKKNISKKAVRRIVEEKYNPYFQKKILDKLFIDG